MTVERLVAPDHADRRPAPPRTWDFRAYASWRDDVWTLLGDIVDDDVKSEFIASPPEYVVGDDLSWLDDIIFKVHRTDVSSKEFLTSSLIKRYDYLRGVHCTRTNDVGAFYQGGLRPLDPKVIHQLAREIFLDGNFPELSNACLERAIEVAKEGISLREGRVYFDTNEEMLIHQAGHYLLYGSEYLVVIAVNLDGNRDYRQILKNFGTPTIFICDVPIALIRHGLFAEFAGTAIEMVFQELLDGDAYAPDRWRGGAFCIHAPLPATCIVGHYHPTSIRDPLLRGHPG